MKTKKKTTNTQKLRWVATFIEGSDQYITSREVGLQWRMQSLMGIPKLLRRIADDLQRIPKDRLKYYAGWGNNERFYDLDAKLKEANL